MEYTAQQRRDIGEQAVGRTIQSLEWEPDGAYWVMTFTDGVEISFRFVAELGG